MSDKRIRLIAAIGASAVVMVAAVAVGIDQDRSSLTPTRAPACPPGQLSLNPLRRKHLPSSGRRRASRVPPDAPRRTGVTRIDPCSRHRCRERAGGDDQNGRRCAPPPTGRSPSRPSDVAELCLAFEGPM